jgi:hypothetical protein
VGGSGVVALSNGNYVVSSAVWDNTSPVKIDVGAATFCHGTSGCVGAVSAANSLIGTTASDFISSNGITALSNGNYTVSSAAWDNGTTTDVGAVTFCNGTSGCAGVVSAVNSLIGSTTSDVVGLHGAIALPNGNYVVQSKFWDNGLIVDASAATLGNGMSGTVGPITTANGVLGTVTNGISTFAYDATRNRLIVGRGLSNTVTILSLLFIAPPTSFAGSLSDPIMCLGPGDKVTGTIQFDNPNPTTVAFTLNTTFTNLLGLTGICTLSGASPGATCTITPGGLSASGDLPAGATLTVTYQAQVPDQPNGTIVTASSVATLSGVLAQPNPLVQSQSVTCPNNNPGSSLAADSAVSGQKAGSVLIYNIYTSSPTSASAQNTRINITNADAGQSVAVHLFFVDGNSCTAADAFIYLTPNQTASFLASDIDPGVTGYLVAVATDSETGCPINFNSLIGDEYVKFSSGHAANLGAEAFAALIGALPVCDETSATAVLNFDGVSYNQAPRVLAASHIPSRADGNDTLLILNRIGGNLLTGANTIGDLFGILYDDAEQPLSFTLSGGCQLRASLTNNFPRTTPRFEPFIPSGRSGWMKLYGASDIGLLGAVINFNPNTAMSAAAFNQGHNLHKLTFTTAATLTIPIFHPTGF